jgi:hypothetical protein
VQAFEVLLIAAGALAVVAWATAQYLGRREVEHPAYRFALGLIPGAIGVVIVLIANLDAIPDEVEGPIWLGLALMVSVLAILGTVYRFARR